MSFFLRVCISLHPLNLDFTFFSLRFSFSNGAPRASPCLHAEVPVFAERLHVDKRFGTQAWPPKTIPTYAKASVGHPPMSEIRRSVTH
jgi:hypothetical protein